ncbi:Ycf34 family protein [Prochlorococcus marinus]|uniref:Predicted metal-binding cluster containing protein n=1 Tax=Prochlorococcus marinus (strain SARG / CCMP1375 / SS120) TaxID=167539 RepID=Q7VE50_PROMA|nr:Ycf34 family protein [Prochlorococcus marinus]AAP99209.1 Predicted metal-binding cluster containing protein [Prochlorococcus marinus subsp. marinus str. CCMP1375]KGG11523.1 putative Ycf34 [Prochlorococcus marinus str. LG]
MCICVNCQWVDRCKAYHAVEKQHGVKHLNLKPDFEPQDPVIHISLIDLEQRSTEIEWDVQACKSFSRDDGRWLRICPNEALPK